MPIVEKIRALWEHGIELKTIARYCNCNPATLTKYLNGSSTPTARLEKFITAGIQQYFNEIKEIVGE